MIYHFPQLAASNIFIMTPEAYRMHSYLKLIGFTASPQLGECLCGSPEVADQ